MKICSGADSRTERAASRLAIKLTRNDMKGTATQLLLNDKDSLHGEVIAKLMGEAVHFECLVAFAKRSAIKAFIPPLRTALKRGMSARIAVGLSFHLTHPEVLQKLLVLSESANLQVYLSDVDPGVTFHPKVYAFRTLLGSKVVIGSANLTSGGFADNFEASALIEALDTSLIQSVEQHFDALIDEEALVIATDDLIDEYAREFEVHEAMRNAARAKAGRILETEGEVGVSILAVRLEQMRRDRSDEGFERQRVHREGNLVLARQHIEALSRLRRPSESAFLSGYKSLVAILHSGGLNRGQTAIAKKAQAFVRALDAILEKPSLAPEQAFEVLHTHFVNIKSAGINLLSEILHVVDNRRFAVMNQNAVAGMHLAGYDQYPAKPSKATVDAAMYAQYCRDATMLRATLGLTNFTQLDALFNYSYWYD